MHLASVVIRAEDSGQRLDRWLRNKFRGLPQSRIEMLCRKGRIRVDGARAKSSRILESGQTILLPEISSTDRTSIYKAPMQANRASRDSSWIEEALLYVDAHIAAINKPAGIAVQGGTGQHLHIDSLAAGYFAQHGGFPRLVHRLDKDTTGVLVLAMTRHAAVAMTDAFKRRETKKIYWAIVTGCLKPKSGIIDWPLVKDSRRRGKVYAMRGGGKEVATQSALTRYRVLETLARRVSLVALSPVTGRTHQLRAHMAEKMTPIIGDRRYANRSEYGCLPRGPLQLHARALSFRHPASGKLLQLVAPLPEHMSDQFQTYGWNAEKYSPDPFGDGG